MDGETDMRLILTTLTLVLLAGCATTGTPVETRYKTITVTKRGPCPDRATYERLKASRPNPLRRQSRPSSGAERVARTAAQLGLYEGEGRWADQVQSVLERCQVAEDDVVESEGVADKP
jgi:hypothetical protein